MKSFTEYLDESSLSRLYLKYKQFDSGTISAFRGERSKAENMKLHRELKSLLIGGGYSVTEIDGAYIENYGTDKAKEVKEKSMIVFDQSGKGDLKKVLKRFGEKFDQDSITYSEAKSGNYFLIGTTKREGTFPAYGQEFKLGKPMFGVDGEFHSKINGRPFVFKEMLEKGDAYDDVITKHHPFIGMKPMADAFKAAMED